MNDGSAVDGGHVSFVVAFAGGWREVVEPFDVIGAQHDAVCGCVLLDSGDPLGAGDRGDVVALRQQPGQRDLGRSGARFGGNGLDLVDDAQVALEVLATKRGLVLRRSSSEISAVERIWPVRKPCPNGEYGTKPMPSSRSSGSSSASTSRVHREYSGLAALPRVVVAGPARARHLPRPISSAIRGCGSSIFHGSGGKGVTAAPISSDRSGTYE